MVVGSFPVQKTIEKAVNSKVPRRPAHPCAAPGCPHLTHDKYCEHHTYLADQEAKHYRERVRDPEIDKRYGHAWRKIRNRYIAAHPLCEHCLKEGKVTPAQEVDHIVPLEHGGTHDETNLQALCKPCHSRKTARDGDRWRIKEYRYH